ncbi:BTAD domain-containing putative transcriptional regulator [Streptomyces sp. BE282]|uniref:BTAD domain-containing putative transcriptional regulator n=1 Tax=Streptomyces sp. BE282 TaxID=3002527 RepID=UPI002E783E43|nr:BTAD domain-containing putative transcriptional regulator [Streptomyces sp. BE282]MEE1730583.1 BTAD domain-containing putative transcriptional regulator [Streptomyces sp. BE282]
MRFQLLGPLALADGPDVVVLQPSKPVILLAALLLHANSTVSAEYLQRAVWGEDQPATARAALQTCVLRLRRLFTKHGVTGTSIEAVPGGYRITAGPPTLDLLGFRDQVRRATALAGDPEAELYTLKDALSLWQGSLLANVRSDVLHRDEVPRLSEERLRAVERVCDLLLGLGRCGEALVDLWTATRVYPGHERFHEQLIEALYRTGRQSQALAEYRRVKGFLLDELGVDPSPSLRQLELSILRGEDLGACGGSGAGGSRGAEETRGAAGVRGAAGAVGALEPAPATLDPGSTPPAALDPGSTPQGVQGVVVPLPAPAPVVGPVPAVPHFTGREAEAAAMAARLTAPPPPDAGGQRPLTVLVSGAPGIGKSALAQHVAHLVRDSFPAGRLLVRMTRADGHPRTADEVAAEVAAALGSGRAGERALLVLDDVVDADQVRPLLTSPDLAVVVTSRMGLGGLIATHGGWVHRLTAFTEAESYALLLAALGTERVEAEPRAARHLASLCGHFPAALRILTARLLTRPGLRLGDAVEWLGDDPLARLTLTDSPDHSVSGLFDRALGRLDPRLSEAFLRIGSGPPELLGGTGSTGGPEGTVRKGSHPPVPEDVLEQLADAGLLEDGPPGPYRIHDLLRAHLRRTVRIRNRRTEKV